MFRDKRQEKGVLRHFKDKETWVGNVDSPYVTKPSPKNSDENY